ncbi:hypothetical protein MKW92_000737 [Papaver armeniacum]|nr:hypothetical protein MKW92_000737 [Papaver armeniacum]
MASSIEQEIDHEFQPFLTVYKNGEVVRHLFTDEVPASVDTQTGVASKDVSINPSLSARLYLPKVLNHQNKLPLLIYFHGGSNVVAISIDYRLAPEHPVPTAFDDSWEAIQWVISHSKGEGIESWLNDHVDFNRVFLSGDSVGSTIAHNMAMKTGQLCDDFKLLGIALIHPFFWGEERIGVEKLDPEKNVISEKTWLYACPSSTLGNDDPRINPFAVGAPSLSGLGCDRVLVCITEDDVLNRGLLYYETLGKSGWGGRREIKETKGKDHVFHLFDPCEESLELTKWIASFLNHIEPEVDHEFLPFLTVYKNGKIDRHLFTDEVPASVDTQTGVASKDVLINRSLSARLYLPKVLNDEKKLPLVIYFHGGCFCAGSAFSVSHNQFINSLVAEANVVAVSVDYRLAPEHPVPIAFDDSWEAIQWVISHFKGEGTEPWLKDHVDFNRVFLSGDSAGSTIAHNMAMQTGQLSNGSCSSHHFKLLGIVLIQPFFWGKERIGVEKLDSEKNVICERTWLYACPSSTLGNDDPRINPFAIGAPSLSGLGCDRVLVCITEDDVLKDRGLLYYETLGKSGWDGQREIKETKGKTHVFHLFDPYCEESVELTKWVASFLNQ